MSEDVKELIAELRKTRLGGMRPPTELELRAADALERMSAAPAEPHPYCIDGRSDAAKSVIAALDAMPDSPAAPAPDVSARNPMEYSPTPGWLRRDVETAAQRLAPDGRVRPAAPAPSGASTGDVLAAVRAEREECLAIAQVFMAPTDINHSADPHIAFLQGVKAAAEIIVAEIRARKEG